MAYAEVHPGLSNVVDELPVLATAEVPQQYVAQVAHWDFLAHVQEFPAGVVDPVVVVPQEFLPVVDPQEFLPGVDPINHALYVILVQNFLVTLEEVHYLAHCYLH